MRPLSLLVTSMRTMGVRQTASVAIARLGATLRPKQPPAIQTLSVKGIAHPIVLRPETSDINVFKQIFLSRDYECPSEPHAAAIAACYERTVALRKTPLIIDCGANIGLSAVWYANQYPKAVIIAVEPESCNFAILQMNIAPYPNIRAVKKGISDHTGHVCLSNVGGAPWAWQTTETERGDTETCTIDTLRLSAPETFLMIVKIDIEGGEIALFRSNFEWILDAPVVVFEAHDWLYPWTGSFHSFVKVLTASPRDYVHRGENTFAIAHTLAPT
jgi:FkbM family methyltransferase